jgi:hypothetical protein
MLFRQGDQGLRPAGVLHWLISEPNAQKMTTTRIASNPCRP